MEFNFQFFVFLVFMSIVSFAVAFLAYGLVLRYLGKEGPLSSIAQVVFVPGCIVLYDFMIITSQEYRYVVGSIPIGIIGAILLYYRLVLGENFGTEKLSPTELANATQEEERSKKYSRKSQKIHEARKKRGKE
ncbi:MAG: hypothetical protein LUF25_00375 [Phascolarctobacterium sp.]|nr:hypothetical protein [Phascolarctobacterium sp.]